MRLTSFLVLTLFAWALPLLAQAQTTCEEGRVSVEGGYCCWPGQGIDATTGECSGPPACPAGRVASGRDCVVRAHAVTAIDPVSEPAMQIDEGLVIAGAVMIGIGYVGAVITSIVMGTQTQYGNPCPGCPAISFQPLPNWAVGFVPVFHALGAVGSIGNGSYDDIFVGAGIGGAALEIAGAVLLALGLIGHPAADTAIAVGPVQLRIGAPQADFGLTADLRF